MMIYCALFLSGAIILDRLIGDPVYRFHPVRLMGKTIQLLEKIIRSLKFPEFYKGVLFAATALLIWEGMILILYKATSFGGLAQGILTFYLIYSCIAFRDLVHHIEPVVIALKKSDLETARALLQKIVGRDTAVLDRTGVIRAAIETTAESFVDGLLSPLFWFFILAISGSVLNISPCVSGGAGIVGYRLINTLDSMVGYKNDRYILFGRFSARLDDVVNFIPARFAVLFLFLAALILHEDAITGIKTAWRDRLKGTSPNAAHTESFIAGAFHVRLGGSTRYPFGETMKPYLGRENAPARLPIIEKELRLVACAGYLATVVFSIAFLMVP